MVAIGRQQVLGLYQRAGLRSHGRRAEAGAVTYELMSADVQDVRGQVRQFCRLIRRIEQSVDWRVLGVPFHPDDACVHGGAFWEAIGDSFETLEHADRVINADVLDAWFDPAPRVVRALERCLAFALKTSPPTGSEGMRRVIARVRGVSEEHILTGAGSSDLIFAALRGWITPSSRVLILDPMYGEYAYVLERVIGARVNRFTLGRDNGYQVEPDRLADALSRAYDWVIVVNPNSPTGRHVPRHELERVIGAAPSHDAILDRRDVRRVRRRGPITRGVRGEPRPTWSWSSRCRKPMHCLVCEPRICVAHLTTSLRRGAGAHPGPSVCLGRSPPVRPSRASTTIAAAGKKPPSFVRNCEPVSNRRDGTSCRAARISCSVTYRARPPTRGDSSPSFGRADCSSETSPAWGTPLVTVWSASRSGTGRPTDGSSPC